MSPQEVRDAAASKVYGAETLLALMRREISAAQAAQRLNITVLDARNWYEEYAGMRYEDPNVIAAGDSASRPTCIPADATELDAMAFLTLVLPADGWYATQTFMPTDPEDAYKSDKHKASPVRWHDSLEGVLHALLHDGEGMDAYFSTASFRSDTARQRRNALSKRSLYVDLDVAGPNEQGNDCKYNSLEEAESAVATVISCVGLHPTIYVRSGGGGHLYWALDDGLPTDEWQTLADELKQRLRDANICFDVAVTSDAVRLMRLPGSRNQKPHLQCPPVRAWQIGRAIPVDTARSALAPRQRSQSRRPRPADKPIPADDTCWQRTRFSLLQLPDEALLRWMDELFEHLNAERWDDYGTWVQVVLACKPIADARQSLYEQVMALLVKYSERSSHSIEDVGADIERHWEGANGNASLLSTMQEAEANGWTNTLIDPQGRFLSERVFVDYLSAEHVYVKDQDAWVCVSDGRLVTMRAIAVSEQSRAPLGQKEKPVRVEELLRSDPHIRRVKRLRYAPGFPLVFSDDDGQKVVNTYRFTPPAPLPPTPEELNLWSEFFNWVLPEDDPDCRVFREWFLDALAWLVQDECRRLPFAMLLYGGFGYGKTTLLQKVPQTLFGKDNVGSVTQGELESSFNDWSVNLRVLIIDEVSMGSAHDARKLVNKLKPIITGDQLHVHPKGFKGYEQPNAVSIFATSNDDDAVHLDEGDRRWLVCKSPSARMPTDLSNRFYAWLEGERGPGVLRGLFLSRDVSKFNPHAALPMTESKREMTRRSRPAIAQVLVDLFERREPPFDQPILITEDFVRALEEEGFAEHERSVQRILQVLNAPPISTKPLKVKRRVQPRGGTSTLPATSFLPKRVYVAQRDHPEQWEDVPEALLRQQRAKPWIPKATPEEVTGRQKKG